MVLRAATPSTTDSENEMSHTKDTEVVQEEEVLEETPLSPSLPPSTVTETVTRFVHLYITTLFSLDNMTAARRSPYSVPNPQIPDSMRPRNSDFGEGENVGFRMDPGGPARRRQGRLNTDGGNINVPAGCKSCKYNAAPTIG